MKTAVVGYPRIGTLRELKFALEKYFRKETSADELTQTAKELRKIHWLTQKEAGIDYITSNDFSYYDIVLDTAFLLNIIPERYRELEVSELDKYLAMARGYQGENGDVKALAMKKWFNTNYHYIVPEAENSTQIRISANKLWDEYAEAKELGIETKPVITGVYTLFKLCRFTGKKKAEDFINAFVEAYKDVYSKCEAVGIQWLQFDEPALVQDMTEEDRELFVKMYSDILGKKKSCKILLQTYFGDVRDVYEDIVKLSFDGIGLDFIEGKKTAELIEKYGFAKGTMSEVSQVEIYDFSTAITSDIKEAGDMPEDVTEDIFVSKIVYNYSGTLPARASIRLNVGKAYAGQRLYYSQLLDDGTIISMMSAIVDNDGYMTVEQDHCSTYLITRQQLTGNSTENVTEAADNKVETPQTGDNSNIVIWLTLCIILCCGITLYIFAVKARKMNR